MITESYKCNTQCPSTAKRLTSAGLIAPGVTVQVAGLWQSVRAEAEGALREGSVRVSPGGARSLAGARGQVVRVIVARGHTEVTCGALNAVTAHVQGAATCKHRNNCW